ncbi:hypothetical protein C6N75_15175 [Streptomyces solincola]|uniref:Uncharacterized protein n=1 Tax=Streptomyces solincola TaxID=2100817 RepID=A0A2S9PVC5_9ACTN|nr:hypothetical protein C6N75_15175 [Streptomyces solincola]
MEDSTMNTDVTAAVRESVTAAMRELLTAGQEAVRAAEHRGSPETVAGLDKALCALPLLDMDDQAHRILNHALTVVTRAEDADEWTLLADVEHAVSRLMHEPDGATLEHPAVLAVGNLAMRCSTREREAGMAVGRAWSRGYMAGMEALRMVTGAIYGERDGRALDKAVTEFLTAVRRAIPYAALYETRRALVEFARSYGLFVIGMRQTLPPGRWEYARRIGTAVFLFEIVPPLVEGHPYGSVAVRRTAEDGTAGPVRYFPFRSIEAHHAANEALYVI